MLACVGEKSNLETVKLLLQQGAQHSCKDREGSNLLHLTARFGKREVLEYLVRNLPQDYLFQRNQKGETPLTICEQNKNADGISLLEKLQAQYDQSEQNVDELLGLLDAEQEKEKVQKQKRKEKKYRNKLSKIALKEGLTVEEVEEKKELERERRKQEEVDEELKRRQQEEHEELARLASIRARQLEEARLQAEYEEMLEEERRQEAAERAEKKRRLALEHAKRDQERREKEAAQRAEKNRLAATDKSVGRRRDGAGEGKEPLMATQNRIELSQKRPEVELSIGRSLGRPSAGAAVPASGANESEVAATNKALEAANSKK